VGALSQVKIRRLLKHVGIKPARTSMDPRKDHADVLAELRDVVGGLPVDRPDHAQPLRLERDGYGNSRALGEWPLFAVTGP